MKPTVLPLRPEGIPEQLKQIPRWVCWSLIEKSRANGQKAWAKVPLRIDGHEAATNDPSTWTTYSQVLAAYTLGEFDGIGMVFDGSDNLIGIDLDDHVANEVLDDIARDTVERIAGYAEVSPSGTGLKLWTYATIDRSRADHEAGVEMYRVGRFFTVTGHALGDNRLGPDQSTEVSEFVERVFKSRVQVPLSLAGMDESAVAFLEFDGTKLPLSGWPLERVVAEVLPHLDPDCGYDDWFKVGGILHHQGGGDNDWMHAWDTWSAGSGKYVSGECEWKWDSFNTYRGKGGAVATLATLLHQTADARKAVLLAKKSKHLDDLKAQVLAAVDTEDLKRVVREVIRKDTTVDDTDRNGTLAIAVQTRFAALGSPQRRDDVRKMLRPASAVAGAVGPDWLNDWVFVTATDTFFNVKTKRNMSRASMDATHSKDMPLAQDGVHREKASDYAINVWSIPTVHAALYAPGMDEIFETMGVLWANSYNPGSVPDDHPGGEAAVRMVQGHIARLFPDDRERALLLSWMAHLVQCPGKKIRWAPYIYGAPGTGKTFLAELMSMVMGDANVRNVSAGILKTDFNGWASGHALVVFEEVYVAHHTRDVEEKLKAPISNNSVDVHRKGQDSVSVPNFANFMLLSNHPDGLPTGAADRRIFFLECHMTSEEAKALAEEGYFDSLFDTCRANVAGLRHWLLNHVDMHPEFDPQGRAPITRARGEVIEMSKSDADVAIEDLLEGRDVVTTSGIREALRQRGLTLYGRAITRALLEQGFRRVKKIRIENRPEIAYGRGRDRKWTDEAIREALAVPIPDDFKDFG